MPTPTFDHEGGPRARPLITPALVWFLAIIVLAATAKTGIARLEPSRSSPPCGDATPSVATPWSGIAAASSIVGETFHCHAQRLGTPTSAESLTATLAIDEPEAGLRVLTVIVLDTAGMPVLDAGVVIRTRSLEMDHGVSNYTTVEFQPGQYRAERVSLGMGGDWLVEVTVERPNLAPAVFLFVLTLVGPMH